MMLIKSKRIKTILIVLGSIALIAAANYHGYRVGVTAGQEADVGVLGEALKRNNECLSSKDLKCLRTTNQVLLIAFNSKLVALKEKGIFVRDIKAIDQYLTWSEATLANYK